MTMSINGVCRVTQNGTLAITSGGTAVGRVQVVFNETYTARNGDRVEEAHYLTIYAFGGRAQALATRVTGEQLAISGALKVRRNKSDQFARITDDGEITPGVTFTNVEVDLTRGSVQFLTTKEQREALIAKHGANPTEAKFAEEAEEVSDEDLEARLEALVSDS